MRRTPASPYVDFPVRLEPDGREGFQLHASGIGGKVPFVPPWTGVELDRLLRRLGDQVRGRADGPGGRRDLSPRPAEDGSPVALREAGERLFEAVFTGAVRDAWVAVRARAERRGVRVRLVFDPRAPGVGSLLALPWELLCARGERLAWCQRRDTPVVRFLAGHGRPRVDRIEAPLRVLVAASAPATRPGIQAAEEIAAIAGALAGVPGVVVEALPAATYESLRTRLADRQRLVHALHFLGHGEPHPATGQPAIVLADEAGEPDPIWGDLLAQMIADSPELRLVVLNACDTARIPDDLAGSQVAVATALVEAGLPAVVAMQFPITDRAAVRFSRAFYRSLARGEPVDAAVAAGRQEIVRGDPRTLEWATPALYLSVADGQALDLVPSLRRLRLRRLRWAGAAVLAAALVAAVVSWIPWPYVRPRVPTARDCPAPRLLPGFALVRIPPVDPTSTASPATAGFCLGAFEVTWSDWTTVMATNTEISAIGDPDHPCAGVEWEEAHAFIDKLNEAEGQKVFRLPSSSEWEHAARAGTSTAYSFGDDPAALPRHGNCLGQSGAQDRFDNVSAPVGSFEPNRWGLYDVHGNVWEWVEDLAFNPADLKQMKEGTASVPEPWRLRRGGSFENRAENCRSDAADPANPTQRRRTTGFRVLREIAPPVDRLPSG